MARMIVGKKEFPSKKAVAEKVRSILYTTGIGVAVTGEDLHFILDVLSLHPDWERKLGCGVCGVEVRENPQFPGAVGFWLLRPDGTSTDISYLKCLSKPKHETMVRQALRRAVWDQVHRFKIDNLVDGATCAVTGVALCVEEPSLVHVDHNPTFYELVDLFLAKYHITFDDVQLRPTVDGVIGRDLVDTVLTWRWQQYHKTTARLRLVTRRANLSLLRRRVDNEDSRGVEEESGGLALAAQRHRRGGADDL